MLVPFFEQLDSDFDGKVSAEELGPLVESVLSTRNTVLYDKEWVEDR